MAKDLHYPAASKNCQHCGEHIDIYSNAQKYCSRTDNPACDDDRHFTKLRDKGKHPLQKEFPEYKPKVNPSL